ncbi:MAG: YraN family protein [Pseudomonadota bacterium]
MFFSTYQKGILAEIFCAWALRLKGYRILERRFRCPFGEVDIIARRFSQLVFIEVKARPSIEAAVEAISGRQQKRIEQTAQFYISHRREINFQTIRFDVMVVHSWRWPRHLVTAWYPENID